MSEQKHSSSGSSRLQGRKGLQEQNSSKGSLQAQADLQEQSNLQEQTNLQQPSDPGPAAATCKYSLLPEGGAPGRQLAARLFRQKKH